MKPRDENKIEQIFAATLRLVVKTGIAGITMRQVALEAGLATGTVYIYFKDKDELIAQLYTSRRSLALSAYLHDYDESQPYKKGFKKVWTNILEYRLQHFDESVFMEQCYHSPFVTESAKEMQRRLINPLVKLIERGKEEKKLKDLDTLMLLIFMMGSIKEVIKYLHYEKKKLTEEVLHNAFDICWDGLKK